MKPELEAAKVDGTCEKIQDQRPKMPGNGHGKFALPLFS